MKENFNKNFFQLKVFLLFILFMFLLPKDIDTNYVRGVLSVIVCGFIQDIIFDIKHVYYSSRGDIEDEK